MFKAFSHIYLPVRDLDESIAFYTQKLGFRLHRKMSTAGRASAYAELGGVLLELTPRGADLPQTQGQLRIGIEVDSLHDAISGLKADGVEVLREPFDARTFWGKQAVIADPSGWGISLREYRSPDSATYPDWQPAHEDTQRLA